MNQKTAVHNRQPEPAGGMYGPSSDAPGIKRTYIQGMKPREEVRENEPDADAHGRVRELMLQSRPLAGVLYSVSRDFCGEIFPVYAGRNTIGSAPSSDIYLSENTVSPNHAVLLVRNITDESGKRLVTMNLTDYDSEYGTEVNGVRLGYDRETLKGGEIIRIGASYFFIFVALDPVPYGLGQVPDFHAVKRFVNRPAAVAAPGDIYMPVPNEPVYPTAVGEEDERTFYGRTYAKKEDHSSKKTIDNGR